MKKIFLIFVISFFLIHVNASENNLLINNIEDNALVQIQNSRTNDLTLKSLRLNGELVALEENVFTYRLFVRYNKETAFIEALANDSLATVEFENNVFLVDGENEPIIIKVKSLTGDIQEYELIITKLTKDESSVILESIIIEGYDINFNKDIYTYDLTVAHDVDTLKISFSPDSEYLSYEFIGNENLQNNSKVIVRVIDDEGERSYTFNIHKESNKIFGIIPLEILSYIIFGLGSLLFIGSIIYIIRKNKK